MDWNEEKGSTKRAKLKETTQQNHNVNLIFSCKRPISFPLSFSWIRASFFIPLQLNEKKRTQQEPTIRNPRYEDRSIGKKIMIIK